jgi:hypothetical protein
MRFIYTKILTENKKYIIENVRQAKTYISQGKLSQDELKQLIEIDPTPTRKYVGWMAKQWIAKTVTDMDDLTSTIEQYNTFLTKSKAKTKDINQFKSFEDLKKEVDSINQSGAGISASDLESDYETIIDNSDLLIIAPHTHAASRKVGLSKFAFRDCGGDQTKDTSWCTTYKAPDHFNNYYHKQNITLYYIRVKSLQMKSKLEKAFSKRHKEMEVVALAVYDNGKIDGFDGIDKKINDRDIKKFTNIIGIS